MSIWVWVCGCTEGCWGSSSSNNSGSRVCFRAGEVVTCPEELGNVANGVIG